MVLWLGVYDMTRRICFRCREGVCSWLETLQSLTWAGNSAFKPSEAMRPPHPSFGADHMPASFRLFEEMNYQQSVPPRGSFSRMAFKLYRNRSVASSDENSIQ